MIPKKRLAQSTASAGGKFVGASIQVRPPHGRPDAYFFFLEKKKQKVQGRTSLELKVLKTEFAI